MTLPPHPTVARNLGSLIIKRNANTLKHPSRTNLSDVESCLWNLLAANTTLLKLFATLFSTSASLRHHRNFKRRLFTAECVRFSFFVFRLFERNGRSCQQLNSCRKSSERKCAEVDIKREGSCGPVQRNLFEGELRKGTLALWNALHIAAVTLLPFHYFPFFFQFREHS